MMYPTLDFHPEEFWMKQFARSVPAILCLSIGSLSLMTLAGCGSSGNGAAAGAKSVYSIEGSYDASTGILQESVVGFSASATGSTTPTSTLVLPNDFDAFSLVVGPQGQIYVAGFQQVGNAYITSGQILEYPAGSSGSAAPSVTLNGSPTSGATFTFPAELAVNSAGTLFVSSWDGTLEAFASGFTSTSAPTQYLTWGMQTDPTTGYSNFNGYGGFLGVDTAGEVFYLDPGTDSGAIDVFAAGATGATAPVRTITGTDTGVFVELKNIAVDEAGDVYVTNYNYADDPNQVSPEGNATSNRWFAMATRHASSLAAHSYIPEDGTQEPTEIIEFAAGATGNATPLKRIGGAATNIVEPDALAVDAASNVYYVDDQGIYYTEVNGEVLLEVFGPNASGNAAPTASMTSAGLTAGGAEGLAIY
jgi:hypothetical protein